jgi:peptidoglycan/xylan/chitin deacetylase (PgdA/CDA1 family)
MHRFFISIPFWVRWIFPHYIWRMPTREKVLYLTFDDGPHPQITPFVLDSLKKADAKATFFCIGKNVLLYPDVYRRIIAEGHAVGNHTHNHLKGSKTSAEAYAADIKKAAHLIHSHLFRPPYGRITRRQAAAVPAAINRRDAKIIMWDVLSADFDPNILPQKCFDYVLRHARPGSVIVFHDSEKAYANMQYALPLVLQHFAAAGYRFEKIEG